LEEAKSELADRYLDYDKQQRDYDSGKFFRSGYKTAYRKRPA
jgi:hypothetical protein